MFLALRFWSPALNRKARRNGGRPGSDSAREHADRIIVATALTGHRLMTADRLILECPGPINRLDATK